jgi:hypothetical protein
MAHHRSQIAITLESEFVNLFYGFIDDGINNVLRCSSARIHKNIISSRVIGHYYFASI